MGTAGRSWKWKQPWWQKLQVSLLWRIQWDKLNTNKWHLRDEQGKTRNYINDVNNDNDKIEIYTLYEPKHNYLDGNGHLVQRWTKNPNDPPQANDDFKDCFD